jgi:hypothetical protein
MQPFSQTTVNHSHIVHEIMQPGEFHMIQDLARR